MTSNQMTSLRERRHSIGDNVINVTDISNFSQTTNFSDDGDQKRPLKIHGITTNPYLPLYADVS